MVEIFYRYRVHYRRLEGQPALLKLEEHLLGCCEGADGTALRPMREPNLVRRSLLRPGITPLRP